MSKAPKGADSTISPKTNENYAGLDGYSPPNRLECAVVEKSSVTKRKNPFKATVYYHILSTPLGDLVVCFEGGAVSFTHFGNSPTELTTLVRAQHPERRVSPSSEAQTNLIVSAQKVFHTIIDGATPSERLEIQPSGTPFQIDVWNYLLSIPPGETRTYQEVAHAIGRPRAVRAVASACARNDLALLIPCHRVVRGDGTIGGYRWGIEKKRSLLESEQRARHRGVNSTTASE